jgi:hypothetical protein
MGLGPHAAQLEFWKLRDLKWRIHRYPKFVTMRRF